MTLTLALAHGTLQQTQTNNSAHCGTTRYTLIAFQAQIPFKPYVPDSLDKALLSCKGLRPTKRRNLHSALGSPAELIGICLSDWNICNFKSLQKGDQNPNCTRPAQHINLNGTKHGELNWLRRPLNWHY